MFQEIYGFGCEVGELFSPVFLVSFVPNKDEKVTWTTATSTGPRIAPAIAEGIPPHPKPQ